MRADMPMFLMCFPGPLSACPPGGCSRSGTPVPSLKASGYFPSQAEWTLSSPPGNDRAPTSSPWPICFPIVSLLQRHKCVLQWLDISQHLLRINVFGTEYLKDQNTLRRLLCSFLIESEKLANREDTGNASPEGQCSFTSRSS